MGTKKEIFELDRDSKVIIEIYKIFYNENPDFSDQQISIKIQTMMSILAEFGITLPFDYSFDICNEDNIPISLNLEQEIQRLSHLGKMPNIENLVELKERPKRIIKIVGEYIRKAMDDGNNANEVLITISKIIYAGRYDLSSNANVQELSTSANCTPDEVESSIKLVKSIERKIEQSDK